MDISDCKLSILERNVVKTSSRQPQFPFIQLILNEVSNKKHNQLEIIIVWNKNKLPAHEE